MLPTDWRVLAADVDARIRSLECGRPGCPCHHAGRTREGLTHCPGHGPDNAPSLSVKVTLDGKPLVHCFAGCEQMALWRMLFGDIQVAWHKAQWETGAVPLPSQTSSVNYATLAEAELRDVVQHLGAAEADDERRPDELTRIRRELTRARAELQRRQRAREIWQ